MGKAPRFMRNAYAGKKVLAGGQSTDQGAR